MCRKGIKVNVCNRKGYTPVHYAALNGTEQVVQTILKCAGDDLDINTYKAGWKEKVLEKLFLKISLNWLNYYQKKEDLGTKKKL